MRNDFIRQERESRNKQLTDKLDMFYRCKLRATGIERVTDLTRQKQGIDVILTGQWGTVTIDEKIRTEDYNDFLIERYSSLRKKSIGWTIDPKKITDLIVYRVPDYLYLIPYKPLRSLILSNQDHFFYFGREHRAPNPGYTAINYECPWQELEGQGIKKYLFLS